jgi:hypothetical protein
VIVNLNYIESNQLTGKKILILFALPTYHIPLEREFRADFKYVHSIVLLHAVRKWYDIEDHCKQVLVFSHI